MKERERERKRRGKTLLKNIAHTTEKKRRRIKINEREREDRRVLFIRDKKRYKDIYINTHQTLWRTLLLLLLLLLLLNATTSIYILPAPTSRVSSSLKQEEKQDKSLGFLIENRLRHFRPRIYFKNIQTNKNKMQSMIAQRASAFAHCKVITRQVRLLRVLSSL